MNRDSTMEIWKDINGYEGLYQVSNMGRVKALEREWTSGDGAKRKHDEIIMKTSKNSWGYLTISLCKNSIRRSKRVNRLVAEAFVPNPRNKPEANHKDGIKTNNYPYNLEWTTSSENTIHAYENGLKRKGEQCYNTKLTGIQVYRIKWIAKYINVEHGYWGKLAKALDVTSNVISHIVNNRSWKHIKV